MSIRLPQFDVIKGVAIFMVVMGHVLTMCIRDIDQALTFKLIGQTHMPLFFFVAGYFSYKQRDGVSFVCPNLIQRFTQLIIPMIAVGALWLWYFPHSGLQSPLATSVCGALADEWKDGYWFPLVLFEIVLIYAASTPLLRHVRSSLGEIFVMLAVWAVILWLQVGILPDNVVRYSSLGLTVTFFPVFMSGTFARKYSEGFARIYTNRWITLAAIMLGAYAVYVRMYYWEFEMMSMPIVEMMVTVVWHLALAIIAFAVITPWVNNNKDTSDTGGRSMIDLWCLLGRESLGIYLLHYFFLFPMAWMQEPLRMMGLGFVPTLVIAGVTASAIVAVTLAAIRIIKICRPLSAILIGGK